MKHIAIIAAVKTEIRHYLKALAHLETAERGGMTFWTGTYAGYQVSVARSGVGKVNAAMAATLLAQKAPALVINTGTAGSLQADLPVGSVLLAEEVRYHDVDVTAFQNEWGQMDGEPASFKTDPALRTQLAKLLAQKGEKVVTGLLVSGDQFLGEKEAVHRVQAHFPKALGAEMEGAAIAQVCTHFNLPFLLSRVVSDEGSEMTYEEFVVAIGQKSAEVILTFLDEQPL